ncbi:hypothetical protein J6B78_04545 [Methanocorpusculum sp.]|nr:hypothetical protein [Methanocorpusculum sp.]
MNGIDAEFFEVLLANIYEEFGQQMTEDMVRDVLYAIGLVVVMPKR